MLHKIAYEAVVLDTDMWFLTPGLSLGDMCYPGSNIWFPSSNLRFCLDTCGLYRDIIPLEPVSYWGVWYYFLLASISKWRIENVLPPIP